MKKNIKITLSVLLLAIAVLAAFNYRADIPAKKLKKKYTLPVSKFMKLQGMDVHYAVEGRGFPLVLIHGTSSSLHTWEKWTGTLKKHYKIIRLDLPAYALTGPNKNHDYSEKWYDQFLSEFLKNLKVTSCFIAGNSRGGAIAWYFALQHPEQVKGLILIDSAGYPYSRSKPLVFRLAATPVLNKFFKNITPRYFVEKSLKEVYADDSKITPELIDRHYELTLREGNREAFIARTVNQKPYSYKRISEIKCPTLIMWGGKDPWIRPEKAEDFKKDIAGSKVIIYPNAGHVPMEEIPAQTGRDALAFLKKL